MLSLRNTNDDRAMADRLNDLTSGYIHAQILFTANNAGLFPLLEEERTAQDVAAALGWPARSARVLLDALVGLEIVQSRAGQYRNAPIASACLVPGRPGFQGNIIRHRENGWATWARLSEVLAAGTGVARDQTQGSPEQLRSFILGMQDIARISARELLDAVDLSAYTHVLDLGGGPAAYAIAFLEAHPEMRATVFDVPRVIPIAREQVAGAGLEDRCAFLAGDMTVDDFGKGYDLILVSNIIHSFGADENQAIVRKCFDALEPGGRLIIKDFLVENDRSGPAFSLIFALHMFVHTRQGDTYTFDDVAAWTQQAGFRDGRAVALTAQTRLWIADKP